MIDWRLLQNAFPIEDLVILLLSWEHALELIFTEDGSARINAQMYMSKDENSEEPEWFPSTVYQELLIKLSTLATLASDMFMGRERFTTLLLIRLTETITLWLSDEQSFWEAIEHGSKAPLGPFGLRQFYLDMQFVILFASQGRYLSRNLHQVIKNIISRVMDSVAAANIDPNRFFFSFLAWGQMRLLLSRSDSLPETAQGIKEKKIYGLRMRYWRCSGMFVGVEGGTCKYNLCSSQMLRFARFVEC
ncbi:hypothetical protein L6452_06999 [Arctium lappa]|uniref:Uncharacterized protein n=1 Tax=Arctium lappa TaxID=4217 RepID=A0ACB9EKP0_ARCLA|nr:hypothetical protein L6452_06999 [Arctium lappa]